MAYKVKTQPGYRDTRYRPPVPMPVGIGNMKKNVRPSTPKRPLPLDKRAKGGIFTGPEALRKRSVTPKRGRVASRPNRMVRRRM